MRPLVAGSINIHAIEKNWDETLRLAGSIHAGTVSVVVMLRKLACFPCQSSVARSLPELGSVKHSSIMLTWFDNPDQRRRTGGILSKYAACNALTRAIFFSCLRELRDRTFKNQRYRGPA